MMSTCSVFPTGLLTLWFDLCSPISLQLTLKYQQADRSNSKIFHNRNLAYIHKDILTVTSTSRAPQLPRPKQTWPPQPVLVIST